MQGMDEKPTPLRVSAPVRLVVKAPPDNWGWWARGAAHSRRAADGVEAQPQVRGTRTSLHYWYDLAESTEIWHASGPFRAEPGMVD